MNRQAWVAWLMILLQAVLFWYLSEANLFAIIVVLISFPAVFWRRRWELSSTTLPLIDLAVAVVCGMKWYVLPHEMQFISGFVMYPMVHAAAQFFLLVQVARLWGRRPDRPLPIYVPVLAVLVFICLGDVDVTRRQRRMYQHASQALVGLTCLYYSLIRRRQEHTASMTHRWVRPTLSVTVLLVTVFAARASNAWLLTRWSDIERLMMRANAMRRNPASSTYSGFSSHSQLGSVQFLKSNASNEIALRVLSEGEPGYLRGAVLDRFNGFSWDTQTEWQPTQVNRSPLSDDVSQQFLKNANSPSHQPLFAIRKFSDINHYPMTIWRESALEQFTFLPLATKCLQVPLKTLSFDRHGVPLSDGISPDANMTAWLSPRGKKVIREPIILPIEWQIDQPFELSAEQTEFITEKMTRLPPNAVSKRIYEFAEKLFQKCKTPEEKLCAVERLFATFKYETKIEVPRRQDPLTYFLFEARAAHCEFFASATAVLLRIGGIPTRYVTGFAGGNYNPLGRYWIIRQQEAHAWVEAYLPDSGWVTVDTTPVAGVPTSDDSFQFSHLWDEINLRGQMIRAALAAGNFGGILEAFLILSMTLFSTIPGWILTSGLLFLFVRNFHFNFRKRPTVVLSQTVLELQTLVHELDLKLTRWNLQRADCETLHQFAERIRREAHSQPVLESVADWYLQYAETRYGPDSGKPSREMLQQRLSELCSLLTKATRSNAGLKQLVHQLPFRD